jgi:hypothetical protein
MGRTRNDGENSGRSKYIFSCKNQGLHFYNRELRQKITNAMKAKQFISSFKIYDRPPISRRVLYVRTYVRTSSPHQHRHERIKRMKQM